MMRRSRSTHALGLALVLLFCGVAEARAGEFFVRVWALLSGGGDREDRLSQAEATRLVRTLLARSAADATKRLSGASGFVGPPGQSVGLPRALAEAQGHLGSVGRSDRLDALEAKLNAAAVRVMPIAREHLQKEIAALVIQDGLALARGGEQSAATLFLRTRTEAGLVAALEGPVTQALADAGARATVEEAAALARMSGQAEEWNAALVRHVARRAAERIYETMAAQEIALRERLLAGSTL